MDGDPPAADQPTLTGLVLTCEPADPCWELHPVRPGLTGLLGWALSEPSIDAGVPTAVADMVSTVLCRLGKITFLYPFEGPAHPSAGWYPVQSGWACVLPAPGFGRWLGSLPFPVVCTADPQVAAKLFYADQFPWDQRTQVVALSSLDGPPPRIMYQHIEDLLIRRPIDGNRFAVETGSLGLMLPGVDGDFAEIVLFDDGRWRNCEGEFARECRERRIRWGVVSEEEFRRTSWFG